MSFQYSLRNLLSWINYIQIGAKINWRKQQSQRVRVDLSNLVSIEFNGTKIHYKLEERQMLVSTVKDSQEMIKFFIMLKQK